MNQQTPTDGSLALRKTAARFGLRAVSSSAIALSLLLVSGAPVLAQWSTATLSEARSGLAATSIGPKALFAGGLAGVSESDVVDIFDDRTGLWSSATLSQARSNLAAASVGTKALFAGGYAGGVAASDVVDVYDDATGMWSTATLSLAREHLVATTVGSKVLFAGGSFWNGSAWTPADRVDIYDDATGAWSTATLTNGQDRLAAVTVGTKAFFAGIHLEVDVYDDSSGVWSTTSLSLRRGDLAATSVGIRALFGGGEGPHGVGYTGRVDVFDDSSGQWSIASLTSARARLVATAVGTKAMFAGGGSDNVIYAHVDIYDDATGAWRSSALSQPREYLAATSIGTKALFGGGYAPGGLGDSDVVDIYDDAVGTNYCGPAVVNSAGRPATITAQGFPGTVAQGYVLLTANDLPPGQFGYFLAGQTQGFLNPPGSSGFICLMGNIGRYNAVPEIIQGPTGSIQVDLTAIPVNPPTSVLPGDTWNFQCWYRDNNPGPTSNFTDAVSVTFS